MSLQSLQQQSGLVKVDKVEKQNGPKQDKDQHKVYNSDQFV